MLRTALTDRWGQAGREETEAGGERFLRRQQISQRVTIENLEKPVRRLPQCPAEHAAPLDSAEPRFAEASHNG